MAQLLAAIGVGGSTAGTAASTAAGAAGAGTAGTAAAALPAAASASGLTAGTASGLAGTLAGPGSALSSALSAPAGAANLGGMAGLNAAGSAAGAGMGASSGGMLSGLSDFFSGGSEADYLQSLGQEVPQGVDLMGPHDFGGGSMSLDQILGPLGGQKAVMQAGAREALSQGLNPMQLPVPQQTSLAPMQMPQYSRQDPTAFLSAFRMQG